MAEGFTIPDDIREPFEQLPPGMILFEIGQMVETNVTGKEDDPCFGLAMDVIAVEPPEVAGLTRTEKFFWGIRASDQRVLNGRAKADPWAENNETLQATMGRFKLFVEAVGLECKGNSEALYAALKGRKVIGHVVHKAGRPKEGQDRPMSFANVDRWLPENSGIKLYVSEVSEETAAPAKGGNGAAQQAAPAPAPAPPAPTPQPTGRRGPARVSARG